MFQQLGKLDKDEANPILNQATTDMFVKFDVQRFNHLRFPCACAQRI